MISLVCPDVKIERVLWGDEIYLVRGTTEEFWRSANGGVQRFDKTVTAGGQRKLLSAAIELVPALEGAASGPKHGLDCGLTRRTTFRFWGQRIYWALSLRLATFAAASC